MVMTNFCLFSKIFNYVMWVYWVYFLRLFSGILGFSLSPWYNGKDTSLSYDLVWRTSWSHLTSLSLSFLIWKVGDLEMIPLAPSIPKVLGSLLAPLLWGFSWGLWPCFYHRLPILSIFWGTSFSMCYSSKDWSLQLNYFFPIALICFPFSWPGIIFFSVYFYLVSTLCCFSFKGPTSGSLEF